MADWMERIQRLELRRVGFVWAAGQVVLWQSGPTRNVSSRHSTLQQRVTTAFQVDSSQRARSSLASPISSELTVCICLAESLARRVDVRPCHGGRSPESPGVATCARWSCSGRIVLAVSASQSTCVTRFRRSFGGSTDARSSALGPERRRSSLAGSHRVESWIRRWLFPPNPSWASGRTGQRSHRLSLSSPFLSFPFLLPALLSGGSLAFQVRSAAAERRQAQSAADLNQIDLDEPDDTYASTQKRGDTGRGRGSH